MQNINLKNIFLTIILVTLTLVTSIEAKMFQTVKDSKITLIKKGSDKLYCSNCGMHLGKFYKTNHIHKNNQYCSIHCLVDAAKNQINNIKVVDLTSLNFIDAKKAFYIVGSKKRGTMSINSKYAFLSKNDALKFQKKYGGKLFDFNQTYKIALTDFKKDMRMINNKRVKKVYKIGKKLFNHKCQKDKIIIDDFQSISQLKAYLKNNKICKIRSDKQFQAISVYLWDIKKLGIKVSHNHPIKVPKMAKCPVCGMFIFKYPKWVAKLTDIDKDLYFDGVKDMMKYIFSKNNNVQNIKNILVTNYYTTNSLDAKKAFYVIGANVYGPMGNELIPFLTKDKAEEFKESHNGKQILRFQDIDEKIINSL